MIQPIMKDIVFLGQKSEPATAEDIQTGKDLLDTITAYCDNCVGMAANMIGVKKRIIVIEYCGVYITMYNPEIIKSSGAYETEEGCLSLAGTRKTKRYKSIKVQYLNSEWQTRIKTFTDFSAQIIQHEIDHCNGIII